MATETPLARGLPHNEEAERTLLGAILVDNENIYAAIETLGDEDFYRDGHRRIYARMRELAERNQPIDLVTLKNELGRTGELESVGGIAFVASLVDGIPRAANAGHYARIVKEKAVLRRLIREASAIITECAEGDSTPDDLVDRAEQRIFEVADRKLRSGFVSLKNIAGETLVVLEGIWKRKEAVTGVASGFKKLDELTSGFQPSDLVILAARPSMGKTAFALDIARNVGKAGQTVGFFSLEMAKEQLVLRMLCAEARVNSHLLRTGFIGEKEWANLEEALGRLAETPIYIDDSPAVSVLEMKAKCRRLKAEVGLGLIVVDYLQLIRGVGKVENRQQEISAISRGLKALAKEMKVPVLALSQLSRASESRKDHRPMLADLRESGAIEQDADVVMFIYRDEIYEPTEENKGIAEIIIGKQRNGPIGTVEVVFLEDFPRFENMEWRTE